MSSNSNSGGGIGLCGVIFIVLLILKLFGVISISWWWVFSPLIIGFVIGLFFLIILVLAMKK
jgi:hypothetical protein